MTRHAALKAYGVPRSTLNEKGKGKREDEKGKGKIRAEKQGMRNGKKVIKKTKMVTLMIRSA